MAKKWFDFQAAFRNELSSRTKVPLDLGPLGDSDLTISYSFAHLFVPVYWKILLNLASNSLTKIVILATMVLISRSSFSFSRVSFFTAFDSHFVGAGFDLKV